MEESMVARLSVCQSAAPSVPLGDVPSWYVRSNGLGNAAPFDAPSPKSSLCCCRPRERTGPSRCPGSNTRPCMEGMPSDRFDTVEGLWAT